MKRALAPLAAVLTFAATGAHGQGPASAIPWLTQSLSPSAQSVTAGNVAAVTEGPIDGPSKAGIGVLPPSMSGLPLDLWAGMSAGAASAALRGLDHPVPPAAQALYLRMLLAETDPPEGRADDFLLARVDQLLTIGALPQAEALIDRAGADRSDLFRRWFDVEILTGHGDRACAALASSPMLSPSTTVRIFCMARGGDWDAAGIALAAAERIGAIAASDAVLLALFIDPALIEEIAPPPPSVPMRALEFVIRETVGLPLPRERIPTAFLHADMAKYVPIRFRMEAAERLVARGVLEPQILFAAYEEEVPAASGGVWDRAKAAQGINGVLEDLAQNAADFSALAPALADLDAMLEPPALHAAAAAVLAPRLASLDPASLPQPVRQSVARYLLLAGIAPRPGWLDAGDPVALQAAALVLNETSGLPADLGARHYALLAPFLTQNPAEILTPSDRDLLNSAPNGAVIMQALMGLSVDGDSGDQSRALAILRLAGQDQTARRAAVELLLLDQTLARIE